MGVSNRPKGGRPQMNTDKHRFNYCHQTDSLPVNLCSSVFICGRTAFERLNRKLHTSPKYLQKNTCALQNLWYLHDPFRLGREWAALARPITVRPAGRRINGRRRFDAVTYFDFMPVKSYRPLTPSTRYITVASFDEITKDSPERSLISIRKKSGGRNHFGRMTARGIGKGHKQFYRNVDFKRHKHGIEAEVAAIEYDPIRTARLALLQYKDGEK